MKICIECGIDFVPTHGGQKICSNTCRDIRDKRSKKKWIKGNPEWRRASRRKTRENRASLGKDKEYSYKYRSTKAGYLTRFVERVRRSTKDSDIDREFLSSLMINDACNLTGIPFNYGDGKPKGRYLNPYAPSLDRIDSSRGYYRDNVHVVLQAVNFAKNDMDIREFICVWSEILKVWTDCVVAPWSEAEKELLAYQAKVEYCRKTRGSNFEASCKLEGIE